MRGRKQWAVSVRLVFQLTLGLIAMFAPGWAVGMVAQAAQTRHPCSQAERMRSTQNLRMLLATDTVTGRSLSPKRNTANAQKNLRAAEIVGDIRSAPLHAALAAYMRTTMACMASAAGNPKTIAAALTQGLTSEAASSSALDAIPELPAVAGAANPVEDDPLTVHFAVVGPRKAEDADGGPGGSAPPQRVAILSSIGPACGRRGQVSVYTANGSAWRQDFTAPVAAFSLIQSNPESAQLVLSPQDISGHWYLAMVSHEPSCRMVSDPTASDAMTNDWMHVQILRPMAGNSGPQVALQDEFVADLSGASPSDWMQIDAEPDRLELRYNGIRSSTGEEVFAERRAYRIDATSVERIQTPAITPVDFVALWLAAPWQDAQAWSDHAQSAALAAQHASLQQVTRKGSCCGLFRAVYRCSADAKNNTVAKTIEVSVLYPEEDEQSGNGERYFFLRQLSTIYGTTDYQMEQVSEQPGNTCNGPNLLRRSNPGP
ncbi:MAG TPA: hypothetical protein VHX63_12300 [Acidobacteriaceae bacterium]|nr:hypothetical protein [Acidobacteriaceae bacterium]